MPVRLLEGTTELDIFIGQQQRRIGDQVPAGDRLRRRSCFRRVLRPRKGFGRRARSRVAGSPKLCACQLHVGHVNGEDDRDDQHDQQQRDKNQQSAPSLLAARIARFQYEFFMKEPLCPD